MASIECIPPFSHALYRKWGPGGHEYEVLAVRGTFNFTGDNRPLALAETQRPIRWQETYAGSREDDPARLLADDSDLVIGKPATDVHVFGTLRHPRSMPRTCWRVGVQVGPVNKRLRVWGRRRFEYGLLGWKLSAAEPVDAVPLDYRHAFGGCYATEPQAGLDSAQACLAYPENPAGCGWLPASRDYRRAPTSVVRRLKPDLSTRRTLPAPQLEELDWPVRSPFDRLPPAGFGPIARWWQPRVARQGTLDDAWLAHRYPQWPDDFDYHFYNSAHPDLIAPGYLRGDEVVILSNCLAGSQLIEAGSFSLYSYRTHLPGLSIKALAEQRSGEHTVTALALDTVGIDLDQREITLTWRALFPPQDPLRRVIVSASALQARRRA